jgi:hypothetical protein
MVSELTDSQTEVVQLVTKIGLLAVRKRQAYLSMDQLEASMRAGGKFWVFVRILFSKEYRADVKRMRALTDQICCIRDEMDRLAALVPDRERRKLDYLWSFVDCTRPSFLRQTPIRHTME